MRYLGWMIGALLAVAVTTNALARDDAAPVELIWRNAHRGRRPAYDARGEPQKGL